MLKLTNNIIDIFYETIGSDIHKHLNDPEVIEIMVNPDGKLWVDTYKGRYYTGVDIPTIKSASIISVVSGSANEVTTQSNPVIEAER